MYIVRVKPLYRVSSAWVWCIINFYMDITHINLTWYVLVRLVYVAVHVVRDWDLLFMTFITVPLTAFFRGPNSFCNIDIHIQHYY